MKHQYKLTFTRRHAFLFAVALGTASTLARSPVFAENPSQVLQAGVDRGQIVRLPPVDANVDTVVVTAIAVDPRGEFLAVAGDDHIIRILNAETLAVIQTLGDGGGENSTIPGHFDWIRTLAFDSTGSRLASAGNDGQLILWDRRRAFVALQEIDSAPALACVRFAASGKQIAAVGFDAQVFLIGRTANAMPTLRCDCVDLRCCAYRDDGQVLAVAGRDGHVHLFDPATGNTLLETKLHSARVRDIAFMPNSNVLVSVAEDGKMVRFDTAQQKVLSQLKITTGRLFSLAILDSRTWATAGSDDGIYLVCVHDDDRQLQIKAELTGHVGSVSMLGVSNGYLISGGFDATLRRWALSTTIIPENKIALGNDSDNDPLSPNPR
jgi:WD40 repeat protein